jgi:hypothetical protein
MSEKAGDGVRGVRGGWGEEWCLCAVPNVCGL